MAGTIDELIEKLQSLQAFVASVAENKIEADEQDILDLNRAQMIVAGIDSSNKQLGEYAPLSVKLRKERGLQTDYIDLRFTGEFQDKMYMDKVGELQYELNSSDPKWEQGVDGNRSLQAQWPNAIGLNDDNEERVSDMIINDIDKNIDKFLTPGFKERKFVNV